MIPSIKELDAQCEVHLDEWVDIESDRFKEIDDDPHLTKKWLKMGLDNPPFLFCDSLGRVWGQSKSGNWFPYHIEYGKKKYGIRVAIKAAN